MRWAKLKAVQWADSRVVHWAGNLDDLLAVPRVSRWVAGKAVPLDSSASRWVV
jgi:hypothetical protein